MSAWPTTNMRGEALPVLSGARARIGQQWRNLTPEMKGGIQLMGAGAGATAGTGLVGLGVGGYAGQRGARNRIASGIENMPLVQRLMLASGTAFNPSAVAAALRG